MSEYPVQLEKVQPPPLREDILARDRLLDWLAVKVHNRVVLVTAEAGYGKTTLLADFARRSRIRILWFRLDRGDRDWVGFIAHLVAAVRRHAPSFGPLTASLLRETGASAPRLESVLDTFLRELTDLPPEPAALVFDDFHLVDDAADIRQIARELLERAPERLTFVFASRRTPPIRLARLRARGEVAELVTDDLRFDDEETQRLFRDAYEMTIEPSLVTELSRRTEGWAASLHLVRTALHDRDASQVRAFIRSLSGAEGHLYDYLAEEVVGDLPDDLQTFLMRTSLLDEVDLELGPVASSLSADETRRMIEEAEGLGLLARQPGPRAATARAHPLVREFLMARLRRTMTGERLAALHRKVAVAAEGVSWTVSAKHYLAASLPEDARRVLSASLETILATGAYAVAEELTAAVTHGEGGALLEILRSRVSLRLGDSSSAAQHAERSVELEPRSGLAVWNAAMVMLSAGRLEEMERYAVQVARTDATPFTRLTAAAIIAAVDASLTGSLDQADELMVSAAASAAEAGQRHFYGVSLVNAAQLRRGRGDAPSALQFAEQAIDALLETSSGIELVSARLTRAWALAHLGRLDEAREEIRAAAPTFVRPLEFNGEAADIEVLYGDVRRASQLVQPFADQLRDPSDVGDQTLTTAATIDIVQGDHAAAGEKVRRLAWGRKSSGVAAEARRKLVAAQVAASYRDSSAWVAAREARELAEAQGARLWAGVASVVERSSSPSPDRTTRFSESVFLSMAAEQAVHLLPASGDLVAQILDEVRRRPERWRPALRSVVVDGDAPRGAAAGALLEEIGVAEDISLLRGLARRNAAVPNLGRGLARRLAPHIDIRDLGHIQLKIGPRKVDGTEIRRKVLALVSFLVTCPGFRAQREEVLDALWPDVEPEAALNSLNQTVYFLRRVFEPRYVEDLSPGYLGQTTEFIWLDGELVGAQSRDIKPLMREALEKGSLEIALRVVREYSGQFALDFLYDDWTRRYRESLHASYLQLVETSLRTSIDSGAFEQGIEIAQAASEIESDSDSIQLALVRLYRLAGAHAAAAEQFGRYSELLRDLGVEPPSIDEVVAGMDGIGRPAY